MEKSPLDKLKEKFPIFTFQNSKNYSQHILLKDGNSVQVQPFATVKVDSRELSQLPNILSIKPINPTIKDLSNFGLLPSKNSSVKKEVKIDDPPTKPDVVGSNNSKNFTKSSK